MIFLNLSIKKSITTILSISIFVKSLGLLYKFFVARFLGFDGMSVFSLLSPILSLSLTLSSLSIPIVINQNVSKNISKPVYSNRTLILNAIKLTILSSAFISICLLICARYISNNIYRNPMLIYPIYLIIPIILFSNISGILKGYLEAHNYFNITQFSNLIEQCVKVFLCIVCITLMYKESINKLVITIVIILSICEISSFSFLILKLRKITPINLIKAKFEVKPILSQAIPLTLDHLVVSLVSFLEPMILFNIVEYSEAINYYTLLTGYAASLLLMSHFVNYGINKAVFPKLCKIDDKIRLKKLIDKTIFLSLFCGIINLNISYFHSSLALKLMFSNTDASYIVKELSFIYFISFINPILINIMQAKSLEKKLLLNTIITHIIEIILLIILCMKFKIVGYKYTIIISLLISTILNYITIRINIGYKFKLKKISLVVILILINFLIDSLIKNEYISIIVSNFISIICLFIYYRIHNFNNIDFVSIRRRIKDFS